MSKRLILILALAFVVGLTAAYAEVQNVKVSGDLTVYGIMRELKLNNNQSGSASNDKDQELASIVRLRVDSDLTDNVTATVRLLNERYWGSETENAATSGVNSDISLDLAYVTLKEFLYSPLTLIVGRQELHFGNEMIVGDYDTNNVASTASAFGGATRDPDLSARKAFDAIRLTLNYDPLVVDVVAAKVTEGDKATDNDTNLYGINAAYPLNKTTTIEGYWFEKETRRKANTQNKNDRVDTLGARLVTQPMENLTYQLEVAYQLGKKVVDIHNVADRRALGVETFLTYDFKKMKYTPSVTALYAYFSGQQDDDKTRAKYKGWDPMFENQSLGDIANALFNMTNVHAIALVGSAKPWEDITLKGDLYAFWWDKRYAQAQAISDVRGGSDVMTSKKYAATELDLRAIYDYTEDVQFSLMTGILWPGSAFNSRTDNTATEVIGSMKVTF